MTAQDDLERLLETVETDVAHLRAAIMRHRVRTETRTANPVQPVHIVTHDGSAGVDALHDEPPSLRCCP